MTGVQTCALPICNYRTYGWSSTPIIINGETISDESIFMCIDIKRVVNELNNDYIIAIYADKKTGLLKTKHIGLENLINKKYIQKSYMTLEELYNELEKSENSIKYISLKETILDKKFREKIREKILEMTTLKLIYSRNTIPEYGYERAAKEQVAFMLQKILKIPDENMLSQLDASDGLAAALCHFYQSGIGSETTKYKNWGDFAKKNPNKISK